MDKETIKEINSIMNDIEEMVDVTEKLNGASKIMISYKESATDEKWKSIDVAHHPSVTEKIKPIIMNSIHKLIASKEKEINSLTKNIKR